MRIDLDLNLLFAISQRNWLNQIDYCKTNNGGMDLVSLESYAEEKAIQDAWTASKTLFSTCKIQMSIIRLHF